MKICSRRRIHRSRWRKARHLQKLVQSTEVFIKWRLRWPRQFSTQISQATTRDPKWWPPSIAHLVSRPSFSKWSISQLPPLFRLTRSRPTKIELGAASLTTLSAPHRIGRWAWIVVWHLKRLTHPISSKILGKSAFISPKFPTQTQITNLLRIHHSSSRAVERHIVFKQITWYIRIILHVTRMPPRWQQDSRDATLEMRLWVWAVSCRRFTHHFQTRGSALDKFPTNSYRITSHQLNNKDSLHWTGLRRHANRIYKILIKTLTS